ncbi:MAG: hypothetical protein RIR70_1172 [Pseudomonadota bacterium]|jgi:signal transduction histidine kinase
MTSALHSPLFRREASRLTKAREEERTRMARELHDALGSSLAAMKFDLHLTAKALEKKLAASADVELARLLAQTRRTSTLVDEAIESCRTLVRGHHPAQLQQKGLIEVIEDWAFAFAERHGIRCVVSSSEGLPALPDAIALSLYRITQEGLHNIARHAHATCATIRLRFTAQMITLEITDDGIGLPEEIKTHGGVGLTSMRERARAHEGSLLITSTPNAGTRLQCSIPLAAETMRVRTA